MPNPTIAYKQNYIYIFCIIFLFYLFFKLLYPFVLVGRSADDRHVLQPRHGFGSHPGLWVHPLLGALRRLLAGAFPGLLPGHLPGPPGPH